MEHHHASSFISTLFLFIFLIGCSTPRNCSTQKTMKGAWGFNEFNRGDTLVYQNRIQSIDDKDIHLPGCIAIVKQNGDTLFSESIIFTGMLEYCNDFDSILIRLNFHEHSSISEGFVAIFEDDSIGLDVHSPWIYYQEIKEETSDLQFYVDRSVLDYNQVLLGMIVTNIKYKNEINSLFFQFDISEIN